MTIYTSLLVYPEGDTQEAIQSLKINQLVDVNGMPLALPVATVKMIAYRVYKITRSETKGETITRYHLELVRRDEMIEHLA